MRSEEFCVVFRVRHFQVFEWSWRKEPLFVFESRIAQIVAAKVGGVGTTTSSQNGCPWVQRNTKLYFVVVVVLKLLLDATFSIHTKDNVFFSINGAAASFPSCNCSCSPPSLWFSLVMSSSKIAAKILLLFCLHWFFLPWGITRI